MRYVDMTPTWVETAAMLITILENSDDPKSLRFARDEIMRMGEIIDAYKVASQENADHNDE